MIVGGGVLEIGLSSICDSDRLTVACLESPPIMFGMVITVVMTKVMYS